MRLFLRRPLEPEVQFMLPLLWPRLGLGIGTVLLAAAVGTMYGPVRIPLDAVVKIMLSALPGVTLEGDWPPSWETIIWDVRLPRIVMAGLVGATLALAGATYQGVFRNPLADPYLIGVASGAGLGATIALVAGVPYSIGGFSMLPLAAFAGALLAAGLAYGLARSGPYFSATSLVLAGVAIASMATSSTSLLMMLNTERTLTILFWLLGGLNATTWERVGLLIPYLVPMLAVVLVHGRILNVLQLGDEQARQLGVNVDRATLLLLGAASLATAAAVSLAGTIGFVGLIVPHIVRMIYGPDYRHLMLLSALLGAAFLVAADTLARNLIAPAELPIGVITALAGGPFFLFLLRQHHRRLAS